MLSCPHSAETFIPQEYQKAVQALFSATLSGAQDADKAVLGFADALGIGADYRKVLDFGVVRSLGSVPSTEMQKFLHSFRNNLDLLIRKTWVEKNDESRKEKLQSRIPALMSLIEKADYATALREFGFVLEELAWLLFGPQSRKEDFFEYVFRIDSQMGLFWWYAGQTGRVLEQLGDRGVIRMLLLLGLCYLTDF